MLDGNCHSKRSKKAQWQEALIQRSARVKRSDGASQSTCRVVKSPFEPELYLDRDSLPCVVCYPKNAFHLLLECRSFLLSKKVIMILVFWSQPRLEMFLGTFGSLARPAGRFKIWQKTIFFSAILSNDYVPSNDFLRRIESISRDDVVVSRSLMASVLSAVIAEYIFKRHQPLSSSTFQMVIHIRISSISQLPMYSALMQ